MNVKVVFNVVYAITEREKERKIAVRRFPRILWRPDVQCDLLSTGWGGYYHACALRPHVSRTLLRYPVLRRWLLCWRHWSPGRCLFRPTRLWTGGQQFEGGRLFSRFSVFLERFIFVRQRYTTSLRRSTTNTTAVFNTTFYFCFASHFSGMLQVRLQVRLDCTSQK